MRQLAGQDGSRRFVVQQSVYDMNRPDESRWIDIEVLEAADAGAALQVAVISNPMHRIQATTYRVAEEALTVNVSINLEVIDAES